MGNIVEVSPEEIEHFLKLVGYKGDQLKRFPNFKDKFIKVTGDLDLSGKPLDSLGNITYVDGYLNVSGTKIRSLDGLKTKRWIQSHNTPYHKIQIEKEISEKKSQNLEKKENGEWDLDNDNPIGNKARALKEYLEDRGSYEFLTEEDEQKLPQLKEKLENLQQLEIEKNEKGEDVTDVVSDISATEDEIEEIESKLSLYDLYPDGGYHRMTSFIILKYEYINNNIEYIVGTSDEAENTALEYIRDSLDDGGYDQEWFMNYVDTDKVVSWAEDFYEDDIRTNPESYFEEEDKELTQAQKEQYEQLKQKLDQTEDEDEIAEIENEMEEILENPEGEVSEDKIESLIEDRVYYVERNPEDFIKELSLDARDFCDYDDIAQQIFNSDGYSSISAYDGRWEEYKINDKWYVVMRYN